MITALIKEYKHIDILVNNAGITRDGLIMKMSDADYERQCSIQTLRVRSTQSVTCHAIS